MGKIRHLLASLTAAPFLFASTAAYADVVCPFTINALWITPDGWVNVALNTSSYGKSWWICSTGGSTTVNDGYSSKTITSDSCKAIWSDFLSLKAANKPISLQFHGPADCSSAALPADGSTPSPFPANFGFVN